MSRLPNIPSGLKLRLTLGCLAVCRRRFLPSPPQMVLALLSPAIAKLPPTTIAICLHASAKIFGYWAAQKAERWDDDESGDLLEVRRVVDKVVEGLEIFKTSSDAEVQERVSHLPCLHTCLSSLADLAFSFLPCFRR